MKKLLTMLSAAVTAFGLQAADPYPSGTSFDGTYWGESEQALWSSLEGLSISEDSFSYSGDLPAQFQDEKNGNNLHIERKLTDATFRAIVAGGAKQAIPSDGLCVDTMIKFTAFDQEDTASIEGMDAKFAVWVKEIEGAEGEASTYQLMVTAGQWDSDKETLVRKDYACSSVITDMEAWYRLTVKAIADITNASKIPGYVVCVNGEVVTSGEAQKDVAKLSLSSEGSQWNANGALFPALVSEDLTMSHVGFAGTGWIDDLSITDTIPGFVETKEVFTVKGNELVESFKYNGQIWSAGDEALIVVSSGAAAEQATDIVYIDGYFGPAVQVVNREANAVNIIGTGAMVEAASVTIDGTKTPYATIDEAFTAVNAATSDVTLKLGANTTGLAINNSNEGVTIVIDLAGKTITQDEDSDNVAAIYVEAGMVVIDDTIGGGVVQGAGDDGVALVVAEGEATLKKGIYNGLVGGTLAITSADVKILASANSDGIEATLPDSMKWGKDEMGAYWMLVEKGEGVTFTVTAATHTTATVEIDGVTVESIPESLTVGQTYKVTFTAANGYAFAEGAQTVFEGAVADADVTIEGPAVTAIAYTITYKWTGVEEANLENIQNANPNTYTIESETITFAEPTCEGYTFKGFDTAEIATGSTGDVTVTGTFEKKGSTKPTTWDEVTDDTAVADLPGVTTEQATTLETAGVKASAVATWATGSGNVTIGDAINLDAFIMDAANTATADELAAKAAAAITQEVLDAIVAAGTAADVTAIADKYPNATVKVIVSEKIASTDTAKFFQLQFTLKGAE